MRVLVGCATVSPGLVGNSVMTALLTTVPRPFHQVRGVRAVLADEMRPHHLAGIVEHRPRPEQAVGDGVEGDGDVAALDLLALDDLDQLGVGAVARQVLAGALVLGDG